MIFARIFNGIFNGMLTSTVPTYQSESSRPERRGPDVMISATVNIFVRFVIGPVLVDDPYADLSGFDDFILDRTCFLLHRGSDFLEVSGDVSVYLHLRHVSPDRISSFRRNLTVQQALCDVDFQIA